MASQTTAEEATIAIKSRMPDVLAAGARVRGDDYNPAAMHPITGTEYSTVRLKYLLTMVPSSKHVDLTKAEAQNI